MIEMKVEVIRISKVVLGYLDDRQRAIPKSILAWVNIVSARN
jgi:hypothetical protein